MPRRRRHGWLGADRKWGADQRRPRLAAPGRGRPPPRGLPGKRTNEHSGPPGPPAGHGSADQPRVHWRTALSLLSVHRAAGSPVHPVVAVEEALVDQVTPQRGVVLAQVPQPEVDLTFLVLHADLE